VRLLERNPRGVELTEYGRDHAQSQPCRVSTSLRQGVKDIEFLSDPTAGEVRIGTTPPLAASFVSAVIDRLSRRHPRIVFRVVAEGAEAQRQNLNERSVDLLVFRKTGPFAGRANELRISLRKPICRGCGGEQSLGKTAPHRACRVDGELWALPAPDDAFDRFVVEAFRASGLEFPRATVVASALEMRVNLLRTGRYLGYSGVLAANSPRGIRSSRSCRSSCRLPARRSVSLR